MQVFLWKTSVTRPCTTSENVTSPCTTSENETSMKRKTNKPIHAFLETTVEIPVPVIHTLVMITSGCIIFRTVGGRY